MHVALHNSVTTSQRLEDHEAQIDRDCNAVGASERFVCAEAKAEEWRWWYLGTREVEEEDEETEVAVEMPAGSGSGS